MKRKSPQPARAPQAKPRRAPCPAAGRTRESRGPETSRFLEDDTFSVERRPKTRPGQAFDDDLIR